MGERDSKSRSEELIREFLKRRESEKDVTPEEYLTSYPELEKELRSLFAKLEAGEAEVIDLLSDSTSDASPRRGQVIGDFRILSELGRGGMGVVYLAEQVSLRRHVALKMLQRGRVFDSRSVERFQREVRLLARLEHPGIVSLIDAGEAEGCLFFVMEYVPSANLGDALNSLSEKKPPGELVESDLLEALGITDRAESGSDSDLPEWMRTGSRGSQGYIGWIVRMFARLAEALAFAHSRDILHRDIKPSNTLVDRKGRPRLVDFGLSCIEADGGQSETGNLLGTPFYMSPEQLLAGRLPLDHRTDIYSLGASLYQALTLRPPFEESSMQQLIRRIQWDDPAPIRQQNPSVSRDLALVVETAMAKNPEHRYPDAAAFSADLHRVLNYDAIEGRGTRRWSRVSRKIYKYRATLTLAVCLAVILIVVGVTSWKQWHGRTKSLEALKTKQHRSQLELMGRARSALDLGNLVGAFQTLQSLDPQVVDTSGQVGKEREILWRRLCSEVDGRISLALEEMGRSPEAALAAVKDLAAVGHRKEEVEALEARASEALTMAREVILFQSPDVSDRMMAIRRFVRDSLNEKPVSAAREEAFRSLLEIEEDDEVFTKAVLGILGLEFEAYDAILRNRFETGSTSVAISIAMIAAIGDEREWLDVIGPRKKELLDARGQLGLSSWTFRDQDISGPAAKILGGVISQFGWAHDVEFDGSAGGTGISSSRGMFLYVLFLLRDPDVHRAALEMLRAGQGDDLICALEVLTELDHPQHADFLADSLESSDSWDPWATRRAAQLLARWGHAKALEAAEKSMRGGIDRGLPMALRYVTTYRYEDPKVQAWATRILSDPLQNRQIREAIWAGLTQGMRTVSRPFFRSMHPSMAYEFVEMARQRNRPALTGSLHAGISSVTRGDYDLDTEPTPPGGDDLARLFIGWRFEFSEVADFLHEDSVLPRFRAEYARRLGDGSDHDAVEALLLLLDDPCLPVTRAAALSLVRLGHEKKALGHLTECHQLYPDDPEVERALALADLKMGNEKSARTRVTRLRERWHLPEDFFEEAPFSILAFDEKGGDE